MFLKKPLRAGLLTVLFLSLTACANATPTASLATPTAEVQPTETALPATETPIPAPTAMPATPTGAPAAPDSNNPPAAITPLTTPLANGQPAGQAQAGGPPADKYAFLGQSLPDKLQVRPGTTLTITWTIKNNGTAGWTKEYRMRYFSGIQAKADTYNFSKDVPANGTIDLTVTILAPSAYGDYGTWWKLTNAQGQNFGDVDFSFTVTDNPSRSTSTPTQ